MCRRSASLVLGFSMIEVACISTNTLPRCSVGVQVGVGTSFFFLLSKNSSISWLTIPLNNNYFDCSLLVVTKQ